MHARRRRNEGGLIRSIAVTAQPLRTLPQRGRLRRGGGRRGGVVQVFVAAPSIRGGIPGRARRRGLVPTPPSSCGGGSDSELSSALALADTRIITDAADVRRTADGPVAPAELFVVVAY